MNKILQVKNLNAFYGSIQALKNINIEMFENEIVSIIGANGAGKSTLVNCISGLMDYQGEIHIMDNTKKFDSHEIIQKGVIQVPEGRQIFSEMSVLENLKLGAYARDFKDKSELDVDIKKVFELFPILEERSSQKGGSLSGGEQQMLSMGRALMAKPKVLLLDEPSMGLAPVIVKLIYSIIEKLHSEGITILLIEQNAKLALGISNRTYVLETGEVKYQGISKEMLNDEAILKAYLGI